MSEFSAFSLGGRSIAPPFTIPSGIVTVNPDLIAEAARAFGIGLITTKSVGVAPYDGYPEPVVSRWPDGSLSTAVGLSTMGCDEWAREMAPVYPLEGRFLLTSVFGRNVEEFLTAARAVLPVSDGIELNFCCPHSLEYGESVARQEDLTIEITRAARRILDRPLVAKLSPNLPDIGGWARRLVEAGADAIAAIGPTSAVTVRDPTTGEPVLSYGRGGLSGRAILSRGLECVAAIREAVSVPIVAGGGIESASDVRAYRAAGGDAFAIGTALAGMDTPAIASYFAALARDLEEGTDRAVVLVRYRGLGLVHRAMTVAGVDARGPAAELRFREPIHADPGQFVHPSRTGIDTKQISIAGTDPFLLGVRGVGRVSEALCGLKPGEQVLVRGPFGTPLPALPPGPVLVAGGCGAAPLRFLAERSRAPLIVLGARTREELLFAEDFARLGACLVTTDDGSAGTRGTAVDGMRELAATHDLRDRQFAICGPEPMMAAALDAARKWTSPERVLACVERHTSCGVGLCGKCSLDGRRTCVDGPWFTGADLLASKDFGRFHRGPSGLREPLRTGRESGRAGARDEAELRQMIRSFHGDGFFEWQFSYEGHKKCWSDWRYDEEKYWGGFPREPFDRGTWALPSWAIGPFEKHAGNPVFSPDPDGWDCGHFGGGVHNGSVLNRDGRLHYLYRGEFPMPDEPRFAPLRDDWFDYLGDIGLAASDDGVCFRRVAGPLLRRPEDWMFSFEDVNCVHDGRRYYMFVNRWDWRRRKDPSVCGTYLAVSDDLVHWEHKGLVFPDARRIHRNAAVLQDPENRAVRDAKGRFVMYINNRLIAYSDDLLHWESKELDSVWPGGECAVAVAKYDPADGDRVVLLTGGHHTGHFYAVGEVLFSLRDPETPLAWLPRPVLAADATIPHEDGFSVEPPHRPVSQWRDTVFLCGMTVFDGRWHAYYGGSEYYTCLATAPFHAASEVRNRIERGRSGGR